MNELEERLRELFESKEAQVGPPPPVPDDLLSRPATSRRRFHVPWWVLVPATVLITASVVVPLSLIQRSVSTSPTSSSMSPREVRAWTDANCTRAHQPRSPSHEDLVQMNIRLAGVCVWRHPNIAKGPLMVGVFAPPLTEDLMTYLRAARPATPNCEPVAPVPLEYRVVLTDTDGRTWQVTVPETAECLGFTLQGERYWVSGLVSALANGTYNAGEVNPPFPTYPAPGTP